jgi:exodeoxyribonuclease VII small subunit
MVEKISKKGKNKSGELSFEEALAGLERSVDALKSEGTTLENVIKSFDEGMAFYDRCEAILNEAAQKIEVCGMNGPKVEETV